MTNTSPIEIGQPVADFTLPSSTGGNISLADYRDKKNVVIYFYPKDNTPGCTTESCDFRDGNDQLAKRDTVVLGISPDDLTSHEKFINKYDLPFPLLADTELEVIQQFDVWQEKNMYGRKYMGVERSTFLIDKQGKLVQEWRKVKVKNHVQEVLKAVESIS